MGMLQGILRALWMWLPHQQMATHRHQQVEKCRPPVLPRHQGRGAAIYAAFAIARISALHLAPIKTTSVTITAGISPGTPIQFQQGTEAGMASFFAATEASCGYNSISDSQKHDTDFTSGHNFNSHGFDIDDTGWRLEGCEPGFDFKNLMMHGMASFFAAAEESCDYNAIYDLLKHDTEFASGHISDSPGFDLDDAYLRLERCEPGFDFKSFMMHLDIRLCVPRLTETMQPPGLRFELGTSLTTQGAQKPGPQALLFSLDIDACVVVSSHVWILHSLGDKCFWMTRLGLGTNFGLFFCKAETCKTTTSSCFSSRAGQHLECRSEQKESFRTLRVERQRNPPGTRLEPGSLSTQIAGKKSGPRGVFRALNLDVRVATASMSLPGLTQKPNLEEGIWSVIFGDGILLKRELCSVEFYTPDSSTCPDPRMGKPAVCRREPDRPLPESVSDSFADLVKCFPEITWQGECELMLQCALTRWLMVVILFSQSSTVLQHLATQSEDVGKVSVLSGMFRDEAPATPSKHVREVSKLRHFLGMGFFPTDVFSTYKFFLHPWKDRWLRVRRSLGIAEPPDYPLMPAPSVQISSTMKPLSASEAGSMLRKILFGRKEQLAGRRVLANSMEATMLSCAAKFRFDVETRLQLACHVGGFKPPHTYGSDAAARPLLQLEKVLKAIREEASDHTRLGVADFWANQSRRSLTCKASHWEILRAGMANRSEAGGNSNQRGSRL